jgi:hypothetical protein
MFVSKDVKILINDIRENYIDWELRNYTFDNKISYSSIWIANGAFNIDFSPNIKAFNIFEKIAIHKSIKYAIIKKSLLKKTRKEEE